MARTIILDPDSLGLAVYIDTRSLNTSVLKYFSLDFKITLSTGDTLCLRNSDLLKVRNRPLPVEAQYVEVGDRIELSFFHEGVVNIRMYSEVTHIIHKETK